MSVASCRSTSCISSFWYHVKGYSRHVKAMHGLERKQAAMFSTHRSNSSFQNVFIKRGKQIIPICFLGVSAAYFMANEYLELNEFEYVVAPFEGPSMMPTIQPKNGLYLVKMLRKNDSVCMLQRGSIVVCRDPLQERIDVSNNDAEKGKFNRLYDDSDRRFVCKRAVAIEGDLVEIAGKNKIDNKDNMKTKKESIMIPKNHIWLEGDLPSWSIDSREYGPVSSALIRGIVVAQIWPLSFSPRLSNQKPPILKSAPIGPQCQRNSKVIKKI